MHRKQKRKRDYTNPKSFPKQTTETMGGGGVFARHLPDKGLLSVIHKVLKQIIQCKKRGGGK